MIVSWQDARCHDTGIYSIIPAPNERKLLYNFLQSSNEKNVIINYFYILDGFNNERLSPVTKRFLETPNAGGSSIFSEAISCELFTIFHRGKDIKTEMEINYICEAFKPVDMIIKFPTKSHDINVAISTTRAMFHWGHHLYTKELAHKLVARKVTQLILARDAVCDNDAFQKGILHVFCQTERIAHLIAQAFNQLENTEDILCICTVTDCKKIYTNY
jgi:hypothetical protein